MSVPKDPTLRSADAEAVRIRAEELFRSRWDENVRRVDRLFAWILIGQWLFGIALAVTLSPYTWEGKTRSIHVHVPVAVILGALINALPLLLVWRRPGTTLTRYSIAVAQMLWSALLIHLTGGRIETHFHVFGSLALLAFYRDWRVLVPASLVVAGDHLVRQIFWPESVYGISSPESWRFLEHAFWVAFEDSFLIGSCVIAQREMRKLAEQQASIEASERTERELAIATQIQTAVLPRVVGTSHLAISARMIPAAEVGGDYYDFIPTDDGCWISIGDVAGHGLEAGLVMLQVQSAVKALANQRGDQSPAVLLQEVNRVLYENFARSSAARLHMTLSLLRYHDDGRIEMAGAHEDVIVYRAATKRCEVVETRGTWVGLVEDISHATEIVKLELAEGDVLVLYTDGVTEAGAHAGERFGVDRVRAAIEGLENVTAARVREAVLGAVAKWSNIHHDDVTIIAAERLPRADSLAA
jgi:serine phosphatase RsbU (regulator of sigma subunit)